MNTATVLIHLNVPMALPEGVAHDDELILAAARLWLRVRDVPDEVVADIEVI